MRLRHYTEQPSELRTSTATESGLAQIEGGGFVTLKMLRDALDYWTLSDPVSARLSNEAAPLAALILVDLREVIGYEAGCIRITREWLRNANTFGVRRIALVASSSVLRTATRVATELTSVDLRMFDHEAAARRWLLQDDKRPRSSSESSQPTPL